MMNWISISVALPELRKPVLLLWSPSPFHTDGHHYIDGRTWCRVDHGDEWLWYEYEGTHGNTRILADDPQNEWEPDEMPTHWWPVPGMS